jgi:predicted nuclease of predicted toxin-antitoxin system
MRFFADENVARPIVQWLRQSGHDVLYAAETGPGREDAVWLHEAEQSERLIVTADKDFGELIFRDRLNSHGVVLMRMHRLSLQERLARLAQAWSTVEANPIGKFIVITEGRVRVRNLKLGGKGQDGSDRLA